MFLLRKVNTKPPSLSFLYILEGWHFTMFFQFRNQVRVRRNSSEDDLGSWHSRVEKWKATTAAKSLHTTSLVSIPERFSLWLVRVRCSCSRKANVHRQNNFHGFVVSCAGQSWRGCSRRHLGQLSSTGTTSAPTWTLSGGTWECARSTMCYSTSEWLQVALLCCPPITGGIVIFFLHWYVSFLCG